MIASPARELGFALNDVARMLRTFSDQKARELNMTRAQWAVLARLQRCQGAKQSELAQLLDIAPITLTRLIDKLCDSGLVERRADSEDRRANRLFLTSSAAPTLKRLAALGEHLMGRALAGLDSKAIGEMIGRIEIIRGNLKIELDAKV